MDKIMRFSAIMIVCAALSGCYTQLHRPIVSTTYSQSYGQTHEDGKKQSDTFYVVIDTVFKNGDTLVDTMWYPDRQSIPDSVTQDRSVQTIIREPGTREYCFWVRDFLGYPELRCFSSYEEYQFYLSSSAPWWIRDRMYSYSFYGYPPYYYYDPFSGYYHYYRDYNRIYHPHRDQDHFRRPDVDGTQHRRSRSYTPGASRMQQGGNTSKPSSESKTPSSHEPGRRERGYQGRTESSTPPAGAGVSSPNNQGSSNEGRRTDGGGGNNGSSQGRRNPRSQ
jgi:hypothetical protein